jgi:nicotinamidase-related amidase
MPSGLPPTTALLVVDMQNRCASTEYGNLPRARARGLDEAAAHFETELAVAIPHIAQLLGAFRSRKMEILYTVIESLTADGRDRSLEYKHLGIHCAPGAVESQVIAPVAPQGDEFVLAKSCASAFNGTPLDHILRNLGITHLVVAGVVLTGCVEGAVRDAADRGYEVVVAEDATAGWSAAMRSAAIRAISGSYAAVLSTREIVAQLPSPRRPGSRVRTPARPAAAPAPSSNAPDLFDPELARRHDGLPDPALEPRRSALLIVDLQLAFAAPGMDRRHPLEGTGDDYYRHRLKELVIPSVRRLLDAARASQMEVIYAVVEAHTRDGRERGGLHRRLGILIPAGSAGAGILPAVAPQPDDIVLRRTADSAFANGQLHYVLGNLGIRNLVAVGTGLSGRLESTIRDASNLGYRCVVVDDAVVGETAEDHAATRNALHGIYALFKTTVDVVDVLQARAARGTPVGLTD